MFLVVTAAAVTAAAETRIEIVLAGSDHTVTLRSVADAELFTTDGYDVAYVTPWVDGAGLGTKNMTVYFGFTC